MERKWNLYVKTARILQLWILIGKELLIVLPNSCYKITGNRTNYLIIEIWPCKRVINYFR